MISKISLNKYIRHELSEIKWLTILSAIVSFIAMPFASVINHIQDSEYLYNDPVSLINNFRQSVAFGASSTTIFFALCMGILAAFAVFSYLYKSEQCDFFHSIALKRNSLFAAKSLASLISFGVPFAVFALICIPIACVFGAANAALIGEILLNILFSLLCFMVSFFSTVAAIMLTGRMLTGVLALAVFNCYGPMVLGVILACVGQFFTTYLGTAFSTLSLRLTSPWLFCMFYSDTPSAKLGVSGYLPETATWIILIVLIVIIGFIGLILFNKRAMESASESLAFRKMEYVLKFLLVIPFAIFASSIRWLSADTTIISIIVVIIFAAIGCLITEFIYRCDVKKALNHFWTLPVIVFISVFILIVIKLTSSGFNSYIPEKDEVASMSVTDSYTEYYLDENGSLSYHRNSGGYASTTDTLALLDSMKFDDFDEIYDMAATAASVGNDIYKDKYEETKQIYVRFDLENGKNIYRKYTVPIEQHDEVFSELFKRDTFKQGIVWPAYLSDKILDYTESVYIILNEPNLASDVWSDEAYFHDSDHFSIQAAKIEGLVEAYRKDLETVTYKDIIEENFDISFCIEIPRESSNTENFYLSLRGNKNFKNTIEYIKNNV